MTSENKEDTGKKYNSQRTPRHPDLRWDGSGNTLRRTGNSAQASWHAMSCCDASDCYARQRVLWPEFRDVRMYGQKSSQGTRKVLIKRYSY
jgi:hypothetical protein